MNRFHFFFQGEMFYIPAEIKRVIKSDMDLLFLFGTVKDICGVRIEKVIAPHGKNLFVSYSRISL